MRRSAIADNAIVVRPHGGLANRMRSIASSWAIADWAGVELHVCWDTPDKTGFSDEGFHELFSTALDLISYEAYQELRDERSRPVLDEYFTGGRTIDHSQSLFKFDVPAFMSSKIRSHGFIYDLGFEDLGKILNLPNAIFGDYALRYRHKLRALQPSTAIKEVVDHFVATRFTNWDVVGFHVRRGDALHSPDRARYLASSNEDFIAKIKRQIGEDESVKIFVATDDPLIHDRFRKLFPHHFISFRKEFVPSVFGTKKEGQSAALIELLLLSRTRRVFGTFWSSFSEVSAEIGGVPFSCV